MKNYCMMNLDDIKELIAGQETETVEFKETTGQLDRALETLCAFLNAKGGTVVFGVTDKGVMPGQEVSDSTKRNIAEAIGRFEPQAIINVEYIPVPHSCKKIIALHTEGQEGMRPFAYKGRAYQRIESVTSVMRQDRYNELLLRRENTKFNWEATPDSNLKWSDLDNDEIMKTVRLGIECGRLPETTGNDIPSILERFGLFENGVLNHAAAILFAKKKLASYPQCLLRLARFKGKDKTVFFDNQRVYGHLFQLLDSAMSFVFKHLSLSGNTDRLEREEKLSVPYKAIREGIVNALCHRNYQDLGGSVGIAIYDDRVEIENTGSFPSGWDLRKIMSNHASKPKNPLIADILYLRKISENWGRGISLMMDECSKAGLPAPEYTTDNDEVRLTFFYQFSGNQRKLNAKKVRRTNEDKRDMLAKILGDKALSVREMMDLMGFRNRASFLSNYLHPAMNEGFIEAVYPEKKRNPKQKYKVK